VRWRPNPAECGRNQWDFARRRDQGGRDSGFADRDAAGRQRLNDRRPADCLQIFDRESLLLECANRFRVDRDLGIEGHLADHDFLRHFRDCRRQAERAGADRHRKCAAAQTQAGA